MDAKELWKPPWTQGVRTLMRVEIDSNLETDQTFVDLLGKDPAQRYRFIMDMAELASTEALDV